MTLIELITKELPKNFEPTNNFKEADIVFFNAKDVNFSELVFVGSTMGNSLVGYCLNQQGYMKSTSSMTVNVRMNMYKEILMYKNKSEDHIVPWKHENVTLDIIRNYFKK